MDHFHYRKGRLHAEDVAIDEIAAVVGSPVYVYSTAALTRQYQLFAESLKAVGGTVCFALKANGNMAVVRTLARLGAGADVVSGGELTIARRAGVPADKIIFSGVGKSRAEVALALDEGIHQINVESLPELEAVNDVAVRRGLKAPVALRVNPDVGAGGHAKITTGKKDTKFGIEWSGAVDLYRHAVSLPGLDVKGIAIHIGSQIATLKPFEDAFLRVREMVLAVRREGFLLERIDLGGGLGISCGDDTPVPPSPPEYAKSISKILGDLGCALTVEPGRSICGNAGVLVSEVMFIKDGPPRTFAIIDAAMNDLLRPALYDAFHAIVPVAEAEPGGSKPGGSKPGGSKVVYDVVGPVCETGDRFAHQRTLPPLKAGDLVALCTAGAYGAVMASQYNARPLVPEVLVNGNRYAVIRRRPTFDEMLSLEAMPDWLEDESKSG